MTEAIEPRRVRLYGGLQGKEPFKIGQIEFEFVVLNAPRMASWAELQSQLDGAINRERRKHHLSDGEGWGVSPIWRYPRPEAGEAQRVVASILGAFARPVGQVTLVWPSEEVMEVKA